MNSEKCYKRCGFSKENSYYSMKHQKKTTIVCNKIPDPSNAKEYYQSFLKKKNTKSVIIDHSENFT